MAHDKPRRLFVDTSSLRNTGFDNPDFRKLLLQSQQGLLKIYISHIAWEEWLGSRLEKGCEKIRKVQSAFNDLCAWLQDNEFLNRFPQPKLLGILEEAHIETEYRTRMAAYASENKIEIVPIAPHHGESSWKQFFKVQVEPPFKANVSRENRRKDIPDSWICEAAADLLSEDADLLALCLDSNLTAALERRGVKVFKEVKDLLEELEATVTEQVLVNHTSNTESMPLQGDRLSSVLSQANEQFRNLERRVLGFISFLDPVNKETLFKLLSRSGISIEAARNVAQRLAIAGVIRDSGNHYLIPDKHLAKSAAVDVESEIISLLGAG